MPAPEIARQRPSAYGVLGVVPALVAAAWVVAGVALLLLHAFQPWFAVPLAAALLAVLVWAVPPRTWQAPAGPWWAIWLTLAVVTAATVWAALHSSQNLVVRRDPGPYGLIGSWVAQHGTMQIPTSAGVFDHLAHVEYGGPAFYGRSHDLLQPQFLSGLPIALAPAHWVGGLPWLLRADAVIGGFALLAFAGFVARAVGPRAAPFATAVLALSYPETHAFRSPYSEPLTQLLLLGGFCLLWDARGRSARAVGVAGLVLGLTAAVRIDALADLLPLALVVLFYALARRGRDAVALLLGVLAGAGVGVADGRLLHGAYLHDTRSELRLVALASLCIAVGLLVAIPVGRRIRDAGVPEQTRHRIGLAAAVAIPLLAVLAYAVRPYVDKPRTVTGDTSTEVGRLQALAHLPVDPYRTYAERSLHWLAWWVGAPAVLLAAIAAGLLVRQWLAGRDLALLPVVGTGLCVAALVLWRPSITPDHPWADRRFVPVVLPVLVLLVTWLIALTGRRARWTIPVLGLAVLVPTVLTTAPLAWTRTEVGQLAALDALCARLPSQAAVLFVDAELAYRWAPAVRDECGVPTGYVEAGAEVSLPAVRDAVADHGRTLVLLGSTADQLAGRAPEHVVGLTYPVDQRRLLRKPDGTDTERTDIWLAPG